MTTMRAFALVFLPSGWAIVMAFFADAVWELWPITALLVVPGLLWAWCGLGWLAGRASDEY